MNFRSNAFSRALGVLVLALAAPAAGATTYTVGDLTNIGYFSQSSAALSAGSDFNDHWDFSISVGVNDVSALVASVYTGTLGRISGLAGKIQQSDTWSQPLAFASSPGFKTLDWSGTLTPGAYTLVVTGHADTAAQYSVTMVASVPEPHEWAMMLAGLGVVGWVARRRYAASRA